MNLHNSLKMRPTLSILNIEVMAEFHTELPLISVIIPCYNQAHFLSAAIQSVLAQTYAHHEIIVVDDGSTDDTAEVAASYPMVRYVRQDNQGLSSARNTGLRESRGDYLVFLDADDLLLPRALEAGLTCMCAHPECAFVSGHYRYIKQDGSFRRENLQQYIDHDHYLALLRGNYIGMHATVMYRRDVFEAVGDYATSLPVCEDYDLFLRIARRFPVFCHDEVVAEYRQHGGNMSGDLGLMLKTVLSVLRSQWPYVKDDRRAAQAIRVGLRNWQAYYGEHLFIKASSLKLPRHFQSKIRILLVILRHAPLYFVFHTLKWLFEMGLEKLRAVTPRSIREYVARRLYPFPWPPVGSINFGDLRQTKPLRENSNPASGVPIDQFYVESFLAWQAHYIHGHVLEINSDRCTRCFGGDHVEASDICQLVEKQFQPNSEFDLTIPDDLSPKTYDCIIFPQILHRVYNLELMVQALYDCLKPGGVLLATVPGIGLVNDDQANAGYWAFTEQATQRLFGRIFGDKNIKVRSYGNVLTAGALFHNSSINEFSQSELDHCDAQYQLLIGVRAIKA